MKTICATIAALVLSFFVLAGGVHADSQFTLPLADQRIIPSAWFDHNTGSGFTRFDGATSGWYDGHRGTDFPTPEFTPIYAAAEGTVDTARWENEDFHNQGFGWYVRVAHPNGYYTYYGHMHEEMQNHPEVVWVGRQVARGSMVGWSGNTGESTAPHLDFSVAYDYGPNNGGLQRLDPFGWWGTGNDPYAYDTGYRWATQTGVWNDFRKALPPRFAWNWHVRATRDNFSTSFGYNASSFGGDNLSFAYDRNSTTRWSTGATQIGGNLMQFQIDLGSVQSISGITLVSSNGDHPRYFQIYFSTDNSETPTAWSLPSETASLVGDSLTIGNATTVNWTTRSARHLSIELIGDYSGRWWAINQALYPSGTVMTLTLGANTGGLSMDFLPIAMKEYSGG